MSEEALARAREVNRIAYKERLAEIENLDEKGWAMYRGLLERVQTSVRRLQPSPLRCNPICESLQPLCTRPVQVSGLASTLASATDRSQERVWLRNAADGKCSRK